MPAGETVVFEDVKTAFKLVPTSGEKPEGV
jgi:hypothetical protein